MTAETVFSLANFLAVAGWLILIFARRTRWAGTFVAGAVLPLLFSVLYSGLIVAHWKDGDGGFGTLAGCRHCFPVNGYCWPDVSTTWPSTCSSEAGKYATQWSVTFHIGRSCPV
jgi:hypothetical protein